tara:strand:- start:1435 stop:2226 length:792 start_codon:yes stop_codon:yes gene_type:complete
MNSLLEVNNLSYSWGENEVLKNLSFEVKPNQIVAILGKNGVGKTTLIKCLNRVLTPDSGTIKISSVDISELSLMALSKLSSYVPQSIRTSFSMEVFDVVLLGRRPHISWRISPDDREVVSRTLRLLGMEEFAFRRFDRLSGGERQRVVVAKAIAQNPDLFLFDEPTSDLDLRNQIEVMKTIEELVSDPNSRKSAIVSIHDINIAARFADRILLLHEGEIKSEGTPIEVLTEENIAEVFEVSCEIIQSSGDSTLRVLVKDEIKL